MRLVKVTYQVQPEIPEDDRAQFYAAFIFGDVKLDECGRLEGYWGEFVADVDALPLSALQHAKLVSTTYKGITELELRVRTVINQKVNVAVPGLGLLAIREAMVRTDLCTDELNEWLKEGWLILAICPQPDQRRPDYVLGRTTTEE